MTTPRTSSADHRLFVLLLLAAAILAAGWRGGRAAAPGSAYFWANGVLIRTDGSSRAGQGVLLAPGLACAETPPEAARFFALSLPINRADQDALIALPGIGPALAERILQLRKGQGGLAGIDGLRKVKGIGPKLGAQLAPLLCFDRQRDGLDPH